MAEAEESRRVRLGSIELDLVRRVVQRPDGDVPLNPREAALLAWFLDHPIRPATRQELLRDVWGYRGGAPTRVVDMTVRRVREKIEADPASPRWLLTVRGVGYRFEGAPEDVAEPAAPTQRAVPPDLTPAAWTELSPTQRQDAERRHAAWAYGLRGPDRERFADEILLATQRALRRRDTRLAAEGCRALRSLPTGPASSLAEGQLARIQGELKRSEGLVQDAVNQARATHDDATLAAALRDLGWIANLAGDLAASRAALEEAWALARDLDALLQVEIASHLAVTLLESGDRRGARVIVDAGVALTDSVDLSTRTTAHLRITGGLLALADGRHDAARAAFQYAAAVYEELDLAEGVGWALNNEGEVARRSGDLDAAQSLYGRAAEWFRVDGGGGLFAAEANRLIVAFERGDFRLGARLDVLQPLVGERRARRGLLGLLRAWAAAAEDDDAALQLLSGARRDLDDAGLFEDDIALMAERIAGLAEGELRRAALTLALRQRRGLGHPERAAALAAELDAL